MSVNPPGEMLEPYRDLLSRLRISDADWALAAYERPGEAGGEWRDERSLNRYGVLLCMQYDRRNEDHLLTRRLLEEETRARRDDPFQGLTPALELAAFLLARFRDPDDLPLLVAAKLANFDTCLGLDHQYLYLFGAEALDRLRQQDPEGTAPLLEVLEEHAGAVDDASVREWWSAKEREYPEAQEVEDPLVLAQRAVEFGALNEGRRQLDRWEAGRERTTLTLSTLHYLRLELNQPEPALRVAEEWAQLEEEDSFQRSSALLKTIEPLIRLHRFSDALARFRELAETLRRRADMREVGLARTIIEAMLDALLADGCPIETQSELWDMADGLWALGIRPSFNALEKSVRAAALLHRPEDEARYRRLADAERARIDRELERVREERQARQQPD